MTEAKKAQDARQPARDQAQAPADQPDELEWLREQLASAEQGRDQLQAMLRRNQADFENYQKRAQRDLAEERRYAYALLARELLPVLDNLRRALDAARQQGLTAPLIKGVTLVESQLLEALSRAGLTAVDVDVNNTMFDPNLQEAVQVQNRNDLPPGTVVEVVEPGYALNDRILRPAKVVVAAAPKAGESPASKEQAARSG